MFLREFLFVFVFHGLKYKVVRLLCISKLVRASDTQ